MRPHVLISAFSFGPRQGSETGIGWATAQALSVEYDVTVVCEANYRQLFLGSDFAELSQAGIEVEFFECPGWKWMCRHPSNIAQRLYYAKWQKQVGNVFQDIIRRRDTVCALHATWGLGLVETQLGKLGVPVIFGPVGGFERGPLNLSWRLGSKLFILESVRNASIWIAMRSKKLRGAHSQLELIVSYARESMDAFRNLGSQNLACLTNSGVSEEKIRELDALRSSLGSDGDGLFRLLFVGRLAGWKGEELAIRAVARLNFPCELVIAGGGQNYKRCRKLVSKLGLADRVRFVGAIPQQQLWNLYVKSDAFVFPSLHDSGGNAVLEAMGAGLPVVCLDLGAPGEYVNEECGIVVRVGSYEQVINGLATALVELRENPSKRKAMAQAARERCLKEFTWEVRGQRLRDLVREVIAKNSAKKQMED